MRRQPIAIALIIIFFAAIVALSWTVITDPDTDFHLAAGREIARLHHVPQTNTMGYTLPDARWGSHQWLGSLFLYDAWRLGMVLGLGGAMGLALLRAAVLVALFAFLLGFIKPRRPADLAIAVVVLALGAWVARPRLVERPLLFSALLEAFLLYFLAGYAARPRRALLWLIPVFVLWWNLHAGFIYGILILAAYVAGDLLDRRDRGAAAALAGASALAVAAGALVTLAVNPAGIRAIAFPLEMFRSPLFSRAIDEFRRTTLADHRDFAVLLFLTPVAIAVAWVRGRRPRTAHLILVVGFAALALLRVRMILDMAVVVSPIVAASLAAALPRRLPRGLAPAIPLLAAGFLVVFVPLRIHASRDVRFGHGFDPRTHPREAYAFLAHENLPGEVMAADIWSGSFLWHFYPQRKTFIHNQLEVYGEPFWRDIYLPLLGANGDWAGTLRKYRVNTVMLRYSGERYGQRIATALFADPDWRLVYWDDVAMIFARNTPQAAGVIGKYAFSVVDPEETDFARLVAAGGGPAAEGELLRNLQLHPDCRRAWSYLGETRLQLGEIPQGEEAYKRLLALADHPGEQAAALAGLARARWLKKETGAAESLYTAALAVRPDDGYLFAHRARLRLDRQNAEGARQDAERAARSAGASPIELVYLGGAFADLGKTPEAEGLFARAAALVPAAADRARILEGEGIAWENAHNRKLAGESYRAAMAADPTWVDPANNLAWLLLDEGHAPEGLDLARTAVRLGPRDGYPWGTLGRALLETGKADSSVAAYAQAMTLLEPGDGEARATTLVGMARAQLAAGHRDDAKQSVARAESLGLSAELRAQADSLRKSMGGKP